MIDARYGHRLAVVSRTLPSQSWSGTDIDRVLRQKLDACLSVLDAVAVITHFPREQVTLTHSTARARLTKDDLANAATAIENAVKTTIRGNQAFHTIANGRHLVILPIADPEALGQALTGYVGLIYNGYPSDEQDAQNVFFITAYSAGALLFQALQHRTRLFLPFAARFAEFYWEQSAAGTNASPPLLPPWQLQMAVRTVTLSLDLRKSTFCMENADDLGAFAAWLQTLVALLTRATYACGGVFDKFTGDGVLVHFVEEVCERVDGRSAMAAAIDCAVVMQDLVARHIDQLREFLRVDSQIIGGAIGLDSAPAHWYLDDRYNPMIIGRGVVNACRLIASAAAGSIRLTNIAYRKLPDHLRPYFRSVAFVSKEFGAAMETSVWELGAATAFPHARMMADTLWHLAEMSPQSTR